MKKILLSVFLAPLCAMAGVNQTQQATDKCEANKQIERVATVVKSVDGDTVHVETSSGIYSVRFLGIDTPETHFMGQSQGKWGDAAAEKNKELLPIGTRVNLEFGEEPCDSRGRVLAFVHVGKMNVNAELVKQGLAVNYCVAPTFNHCDEISAHAGNARAKKIGMFSDPKVELPYDFRRRLQGTEQRSYVGDIKTKQVLPPGNQNKIAVEKRVFFYSADKIQDPYRLDQ